MLFKMSSLAKPKLLDLAKSFGNLLFFFLKPKIAYSKCQEMLWDSQEMRRDYLLHAVYKQYGSCTIPLLLFK